MIGRYSFAAYGALLSFAVIGLVGALGLFARQPWLFPSLGPTIFLLAASPDEPAARAWNTFVGHGVGVAAGFGALFLFGAQDAPAAIGAGGLSLARVAATAVAVGATVMVQALARAQHPPAAATTMLITLGAIPPGWEAALAIAAGVTLVAGLGFAARAIAPCREAK